MMIFLTLLLIAPLVLMTHGLSVRKNDRASPIPRLDAEIFSKLENLFETKDEIQLLNPSQQSPPLLTQGEGIFPNHLAYSERLQYFEQQTTDPQALHSTGLLLWSGFCGRQDEVQSAKKHWQSALLGNLDSIAVLGGCIRKGVGLERNEKFGLQLIHYSASLGNPNGLNKLAALSEENSEYGEAMKIFKSCQNPNALMLFNMGYLLVHGLCGKDKDGGLVLWKQAADLAPDEGSEEAAYFISTLLQYDETERLNYLRLAADLGYPEAMTEVAQLFE